MARTTARGMRARVLLGAGAACLAATGCALLGTYDFDGHFLEAGAAPDSAADVAGDAVQQADVPVCVADAQLLEDKHNCGTCGHDCLGGDCAAGVCQPITLARAPIACNYCGPTSLAVAGSSVFYTVYGSDAGGIHVADLNDGGVARFAPWQPYAGAVAADSSYVYWGAASNIFRCALGGCGGTPEIFAQEYPVQNIAFADASVYWTATAYLPDGGSIGQVWVSGNGIAPAQTAIVTNEVSPAGVVVGDSVYWVDYGTPANNYLDGALVRSDKDGSNRRVLAPSQKQPYFVIAYQGQLYWANFGTSPSFTDGEIMSCTLPACSAPTAIASQQTAPYGIAIDDSGLYWNNAYGGTVMHCTTPSTLCVPTAIAGGQDTPWAIALDAVSVYWTNVGTARGQIGEVLRLAK